MCDVTNQSDMVDASRDAPERDCHTPNSSCFTIGLAIGGVVVGDLDIHIPLGSSLRDIGALTTGFASLFREVGNTAVGHDIADWRMTTYSEGSLVLECEADLRPDANRDEIDRVMSLALGGIEELAAGNRPAHFSAAALRRISDMYGDSIRIGSGIGVSWKSKDCRLTPEVFSTARNLLNAQETRVGTIEGIAGRTAVRPAREMMVWDVLSDDRIKCRFSASMLDEVKAALGRRVRVTGIITEKAGEIDSVQMDQIEVFPPDSELPGFDDIWGMFSD